MPKPHRKGSDPQIQADLSAWAWEMSVEAMDTGHVTLGDGTRIDLLSTDKNEQAAAKAFMTHVRFLAALSARKKPRTAMPAGRDHFTMGETK